MSSEIILNSDEISHNGMGDFVLPEKFVQENSEILSDPQIRWFLRQRNVNGLNESGAVVLIGRKFYIRRSKFTKWFASQRA